jgi:hypothetical protein
MEVRVGDSIEYQDVRTGRWQVGVVARLAEVQWNDSHDAIRVGVEEAFTEDYAKGRLRAVLGDGRVLQLGGVVPIDPVRPVATLAQAAK